MQHSYLSLSHPFYHPDSHWKSFFTRQ